MERQQVDQIYSDQYLPGIIRWGKITSWLAILISFGPAIVMAVVYRAVPPVGAILTGFVSIASVVGVIWVVEPVSYFPIVGVPGTYMSFISGNISNLRIPCATVAQKVAGVEPGTSEGNIIATLGIAISVVSNVIVMTLGVLLGTTILTMVPQSILDALNYLLPALFGALFVQFSFAKPELAPFGLGIGILLTLGVRGGMFPSWVTTLGTVASTILIGVVLYKRRQAKEAQHDES